MDWLDTANIIHRKGAAKPSSLARSGRPAEPWKAEVDEAAGNVPVGSPEHGRNLADDPKAADARAEMAAGWIEPPQSFMDLGCGAGPALKALLPDGCAYHAADLQAWTEDVQQVDLNAGGFPTGTDDVLVLLGGVEHLDRPGQIFLTSRRQAQTLIASYWRPLPNFDWVDRTRRGWTNALREKPFADLLLRCGWAIEASEPVSENGQVRQIVYKASAVEPARGGAGLRRSTPASVPEDVPQGSSHAHPERRALE